VTISYDDYQNRIDAMTLSDLMMMRQIAAQKQAGGDGRPGLDLEPI